MVDENENLRSLQRQNPNRLDGCDNLFMPQRRPALASDHLLAFSGFLDERFRQLDFYLGMLDARHFITETDWKRASRQEDHSYEAAREVDHAIESDRFHCLAKLDRLSAGFSQEFQIKDAERICGETLEAARPLVGILRANIATKEFVLTRGFSHDASETFRFYIMALQDKEFVFQLYDSDVPAEDVPEWLRQNLDRVVGIMASRQPNSSGTLLTATGGRLALNDILEFSEPQAELGIGVHVNRGLDLGWDHGAGAHRQHRFGVNVRLRKFNLISCTPFCLSVFGTGEYRWAFGHHLSQWWGLEAGVELGAGYEADEDEGFAVWLIGTSLTATLLQRVYARVDFQWVPKADLEVDELDNFMFGMGLGFRFHDVWTID